MKMPHIMVLNGPNLNMLGVREPEIYGHATLGDVEALCKNAAQDLEVVVDCHQSNDEGELVTLIQKSRKSHQGIIINAGAYSHTSIAILDALKICELPIMEVHLSNIYARESFRHHSYVSTVAKGVICGLGVDGYVYALRALSAIIGPSFKG